MKICNSLPPPPFYTISVLEDLSTKSTGFLRRLSRKLATVSPTGQVSAAFVYDEVDRASLDAVVIVPHFMAESNGKSVPHVVLRSAIRPPLALRSAERSPLPEADNRGLWEVPAGLVDADEVGPVGPRLAAVRELEEETGFVVAPHELKELGPSSLPAPGVIAERHYFFHVQVDPTLARPPLLDGSPLEEAGEVIAVPLAVCLQAAREGGLQDAKTELALRRLQEQLTMSAGESV